jgi:hypothetical protein
LVQNKAPVFAGALLYSHLGEDMAEIRCIKCGKPLHDAESIARGMGPECAGETGIRRRKNRSGMNTRSGFSYTTLEHGNTSTPTLLSLIDMDEPETDQPVVVDSSHGNSSLSEVQMKYPSDLLALVLSAPAPGAIAWQVKNYSKKKKLQGVVSPAQTLQEIRRMCIDLRLTFFPGMSTPHGKQIACVPYGADDWRFENSEKVMSRQELESYLIQYGMIRMANR